MAARHKRAGAHKTLPPFGLGEERIFHSITESISSSHGVSHKAKRKQTRRETLLGSDGRLSIGICPAARNLMVLLLWIRIKITNFVVDSGCGWSLVAVEIHHIVRLPTGPCKFIIDHSALSG